MRGLLTLLILIPALALADEDQVESYAGRPVIEVIDEFRDAGENGWAP